MTFFIAGRAEEGLGYTVGALSRLTMQQLFALAQEMFIRNGDGSYCGASHKGVQREQLEQLGKVKSVLLCVVLSVASQ